MGECFELVQELIGDRVVTRQHDSIVCHETAEVSFFAPIVYSSTDKPYQIIVPCSLKQTEDAVNQKPRYHCLNYMDSNDDASLFGGVVCTDAVTRQLACNVTGRFVFLSTRGVGAYHTVILWTLLYNQDFGDKWHYNIVTVKRTPAEEGNILVFDIESHVAPESPEFTPLYFTYYMNRLLQITQVTTSIATVFDIQRESLKLVFERVDKTPRKRIVNNYTPLVNTLKCLYDLIFAWSTKKVEYVTGDRLVQVNIFTLPSVRFGVVVNDSKSAIFAPGVTFFDDSESVRLDILQYYNKLSIHWKALVGFPPHPPPPPSIDEDNLGSFLELEKSLRDAIWSDFFSSVYSAEVFLITSDHKASALIRDFCIDTILRFGHENVVLDAKGRRKTKKWCEQFGEDKQYMETVWLLACSPFHKTMSADPATHHTEERYYYMLDYQMDELEIEDGHQSPVMSTNGDDDNDEFEAVVV